METLYEYLLDNYKENEPIFLADLQVDGMTRTNVRQQIKKLTKRQSLSPAHSLHRKKFWNVSICGIKMNAVAM